MKCEKNKNNCFKFHISYFIFLLFFLSCNNNSTQKKFLIGFSQCNSAETWREMMNKEMQAEIAKHSEMELIISDAQQDNSKQVADVENFMVKEIDLLIISPNEAQPLTAVVEQAYKQNVPVIVLDRKILSDNYTVFIGADNYKIGVEAGKYAAKLLNGKGNIVEIFGLKGSTPAIDRHSGFVEGIKDYPEIKIIYEQDGAWLKAKGREIMENALQRFEKIDLVYGHNDPMATGAFIAAKNLNRNKEIYFLGIDGLAGAEGGAQSVANGELNATFLYPTGGKDAIECAVKILNKETVKKNSILNTATIDTSNVHGFLKH